MERKVASTGSPTLYAWPDASLSGVAVGSSDDDFPGMYFEQYTGVTRPLQLLRSHLQYTQCMLRELFQFSLFEAGRGRGVSVPVRWLHPDFNAWTQAFR